jgi:hypothetical protein
MAKNNVDNRELLLSLALGGEGQAFDSQTAAHVVRTGRLSLDDVLNGNPIKLKVSEKAELLINFVCDHTPSQLHIMKIITSHYAMVGIEKDAYSKALDCVIENGRWKDFILLTTTPVFENGVVNNYFIKNLPNALFVDKIFQNSRIPASVLELSMEDNTFKVEAQKAIKSVADAELRDVFKSASNEGLLSFYKEHVERVMNKELFNFGPCENGQYELALQNLFRTISKYENPVLRTFIIQDRDTKDVLKCSVDEIAKGLNEKDRGGYIKDAIDIFVKLGSTVVTKVFFPTDSDRNINQRNSQGTIKKVLKALFNSENLDDSSLKDNFDQLLKSFNDDLLVAVNDEDRTLLPDFFKKYFKDNSLSGNKLVSFIGEAYVKTREVKVLEFLLGQGVKLDFKDLADMLLNVLKNSGGKSELIIEFLSNNDQLKSGLQGDEEYRAQYEDNLEEVWEEWMLSKNDEKDVNLPMYFDKYLKDHLTVGTKNSLPDLIAKYHQSSDGFNAMGFETNEDIYKLTSLDDFVVSYRKNLGLIGAPSSCDQEAYNKCADKLLLINGALEKLKSEKVAVNVVNIVKHSYTSASSFSCAVASGVLTFICMAVSMKLKDMPNGLTRAQDMKDYVNALGAIFLGFAKGSAVVSIGFGVYSYFTGGHDDSITPMPKNHVVSDEVGNERIAQEKNKGDSTGAYNSDDVVSKHNAEELNAGVSNDMATNEL